GPRELEVVRHQLLVAGQSVLHAASQAIAADLGHVRCGVLQRLERIVALLLAEIGPRLQQDDVGNHSSSSFFRPPSPLRGFGGTGPLWALRGFGGTGPLWPLRGFGSKRSRCSFALKRARLTSRGTLNRSRGSLCSPPGRQSRPRGAGRWPPSPLRGFPPSPLRGFGEAGGGAGPSAVGGLPLSGRGLPV